MYQRKRNLLRKEGWKGGVGPGTGEGERKGGKHPKAKMHWGNLLICP